MIWNFCNLCLCWVDLHVIIPVHGIWSIKTTITCYCSRKMLLPRRQKTRRKLCFYYTFGVISIKYVIRCSKHWSIIWRSWRFESKVVSFSVHCLMTWYVYNSSHNCVGNNIVVVLLVLVKICHIMTQRCFMLCTTYTNFWSIICPLEVRC